jgi:DNA topoisomerase-1
VLAALVAIMDTTGIRVGNEEYAQSNGSYGLTTLRSRHAQVHGSHVRLRFRGKTGREHSIALDDPRLARIVKRCRDLPGQELFSYVGDDGAVSSLTSDDVNEYIRSIAGDDFSAKDFRTWIGTVACISALEEPALDAADAKRRLGAAFVCVADRLGNTAAICKKSYVHPAVAETYLRVRALPPAKRATIARSRRGLAPAEREALRFVANWERAATRVA